MTDLRLVEGGDVERKSDPMLDGVFAHLREDEQAEAQFQQRTLSQQQAGVRAVERGRRKGWASGRKWSRALLFGGSMAAAAVSSLWLFSSGGAGKGAPFDNLWGGSETAHAGAVAEQTGTVMVREQGGGWSRLSSKHEISSGASIRTEGGSSARFQTTWGASVSLAERTFVDFPPTSATERKDGVVRLLLGTIELNVPHPATDEPFSVSAAGHQVTGHGAQFSVTVAEEAAAPCVIVQRGVAEVKGSHGSVWLKEGERSGCGLAQEADTDPRQPPVVSATPAESATTGVMPADSARPKTGKVSRAEVSGPTALAQQNRIFQSALSRQRSGDTEGARQQFLMLLREHPGSPLAGQARAQLAQLSAKEK